MIYLCVVGSLSFSAEATALLSVSELIAAVEGVPVDWGSKDWVNAIDW